LSVICLSPKLVEVSSLGLLLNVLIILEGSLYLLEFIIRYRIGVVAVVKVGAYE